MEKELLEKWKRLYEITDKFYKAELWGFMYDSDLIVVRDPLYKQDMYCCVLGIEGEVFGLSIYLGDEGYRVFRELLDIDENYTDFLDLPFKQNAITLYFADREDLSNEQAKTIKELGLKYRGKDTWPLFLRHIPGYLPWELTPDEIDMTITALEQVLEVGEKARKNDEILDTDSEDKFLGRVNEKGKWVDKIITLKYVDESFDFSETRVDEIRVHKIKKAKFKQLGTIEMDCFFLKQSVQEKRTERPFFPINFIALDINEEMIMSNELTSLEGDYVNDIRSAFLAIIETNGVIPKKIIYKSNFLFAILEPLIKEFDIKMEQADYLERITPLRLEMEGFLENMEYEDDEE